MIEVAEAINSFLPTEQQAVFPVSRLEDPVFILSSGQLQGVISQAIAQALEGREEALSEALNGHEKLLQVIQTQAQEIQALKSILEAQSKRLENLESLQEVYHGKAPAPEDKEILREVWERRRAAQESLPSRVFGLEEDLQSLEEEVRSEKALGQPQAPGGGRKTEARIKEVKKILKASGGSRTFQELEKSLGLSPSQFSKLLNHLDKRVFEINRRPGGKRGEKILGLRVRVMELA
jgi:K+/H+ antiporter YhaU regulatory subunit KhtT